MVQHPSPSDSDHLSKTGAGTRLNTNMSSESSVIIIGSGDHNSNQGTTNGQSNPKPQNLPTTIDVQPESFTRSKFTPSFAKQNQITVNNNNKDTVLGSEASGDPLGKPDGPELSRGVIGRTQTVSYVGDAGVLNGG